MCRWSAHCPLFSAAMRESDHVPCPADPGLVLFLGNPVRICAEIVVSAYSHLLVDCLFQDTVVVNVAVETISLLAECDEIRSTMWNELGLVISLNCLIDARGTAEDTRAACKEIITRISPAPLKAPVIAAPPRAASTKLPGKTVGDTSRTTTRGNFVALLHALRSLH